MTEKEISEIINKHEKWLRGEEGGKKANLNYSDLSFSDLHNSNLRGSNLYNSDLSFSDLHNSNLSGSNLRYSKLCGSNLSGVKGLISPIDFMAENFEKTDEGYIAYKVFGLYYQTPKHWEIEKGSVITEVVNYTRTNDCGCGVNVATLDWVKKNIENTLCWVDENNNETKSADIWKVLIRWEWLCGVCIPYDSRGQIRCERVELLEIVK